MLKHVHEFGIAVWPQVFEKVRPYIPLFGLYYQTEGRYRLTNTFKSPEIEAALSGIEGVEHFEVEFDAFAQGESPVKMAKFISETPEVPGVGDNCSFKQQGDLFILHQVQKDSVLIAVLKPNDNVLCYLVTAAEAATLIKEPASIKPLFTFEGNWNRAMAYVMVYIPAEA